MLAAGVSSTFKCCQRRAGSHTWAPTPLEDSGLTEGDEGRGWDPGGEIFGNVKGPRAMPMPSLIADFHGTLTRLAMAMRVNETVFLYLHTRRNTTNTYTCTDTHMHIQEEQHYQTQAKAAQRSRTAAWCRWNMHCRPPPWRCWPSPGFFPGSRFATRHTTTTRFNS